MTQGEIQRGYHRFGRGEVAGLFVSYQRYAALLFGVAASAGVGAVAAFGGGLWYVGAPAALVALKSGSFGVEVARRWPEKIRITAVAQRRIDAGRFEPEMVRDFCGDPCFRVMAHEVLERSGLEPQARRARIKKFKAELDEENGQTLIIDHTRGQVFKVEGDQTILVNNPIPTSATPGEQGISS